MDDAYYRQKHRILNDLIERTLAACSSAGPRWGGVHSLFQQGGGLGHFVANVHGVNITFSICIYPFTHIKDRNVLWKDSKVGHLFTTPRPLTGDRVMRYFKDFKETETFYHRKINRVNGDSEVLKTRLTAISGGTPEFFDLLDRGDLTLLPSDSEWLFICPLPVLASPSTFLFFGGKSSNEELGCADLLASHFQVLLVNHSINSLLKALTDDISGGTIISLEDLHSQFVSHLAAIFLPKSIYENGNLIASASNLIADEGKHRLKIRMGKRTIELVPPAIPDCAAMLCGQSGKTLCDQQGMDIRYDSLSTLLSTLYGQLEASIEAAERAQSHKLFHLIRTPLDQVNKAITSLQQHTQLLRATLYEPDEVLLGSSETVAPYFQDGFLPTLNRAAGVVKVCHSPRDYTEVEAKCVLGSLLCSILGNVDGLQRRKSMAAFIGHACKSIAMAKRKQSSSGLPVRLERFLEIETLETFSELNHEACKNSLAIAKAAFFTPFKGDGREWPKGALMFLVDNPDFDSPQKKGVLAVPAKCEQLGHWPWSPISYSSVLAFVKSVVPAWKNESRGQLLSVEWGVQSRTECFLELNFSGEFLDNAKCEYIRKRLMPPVLAIPPEWRLDATTHGDMNRAFVMLANRIQRFSGSVEEWTTQTLNNGELFLLRHFKESRFFGVQAAETRLRLFWRQQ